MVIKNKKLILVVFMILILFSLYQFPVSADSKEFPLFVTSDTADIEGIVASQPIIDPNGDLHLFVHVLNDTANVLLHVRYVNNTAIISTIHEDVYGLEFHVAQQSKADSGIILIYSVINTADDIIYYYYGWSEDLVRQNEIDYIAAQHRPYVRYMGFQIKNGIVHRFRAEFDHDNMMTMNITYAWGMRGYVISKKIYEVNNLTYDSNGYSDFQRRKILDIKVDSASNIWYIYELWEDKFGMGFGQLKNGHLSPLYHKEFTTVPSDSVKTTHFETTNDDLKYSFVTPRSIHWGDFNETQASANSQSVLFQNDITDSRYMKTESGEKFFLETQNSYGTISIHQGFLDKSTWQFSTITTKYPTNNNSYNIFATASNFIITYNTTMKTQDLLPYINSGLTSFKEESTNVLFANTNYDLEIEPVLIGLTEYNIIEEFLKEHWIVLSISTVIAIIGLAGIPLLFLKNKEKLLAFLFSKKPGDYGKFKLFFLNIRRFYYNALSTIKIIWTSNKKRTIFTLLGFIITGYLLSSAFIISQSTESAMIKAYYRSYNIISDDIPTASMITTFSSNGSEIDPHYHKEAEKYIDSLFEDMILNEYILDLQSTYYTSLKIHDPHHVVTLSYGIAALPYNSDTLFDSFLYEGRAPRNDNEVVISGRLSRKTELGVNDTLQIYTRDGVQDEDPDYISNVTIVGLYSVLNFAEVRKITSYLGESNDVLIPMAGRDIITISDNFFEILNSASKVNLVVRGVYQFHLDFEGFRIEERNQLVLEQELVEGRTFSFDFDTSSTLNFYDEISTFFQNFNNYYLNNQTRLVVFAIPAIVLSIFMIFESSELFSSSYQNEVEILKSRGVSRRKIMGIYVSIRLFEVITATIVSFGLAVITAIPLIRVNGFISFRNTETQLVVGNVFVEMLMVAIVLFIISIPRILLIIGRQKEVTKSPNKFMKILKQISWRDLFFLTIGIVSYLYFYNQSVLSFEQGRISTFTIYLFLTVAGAVFSLLGGLPIAIKILSMLWRGVGYLLWTKGKKNKQTFVFAEIAKDIKYFENITLIFLLVVGILIPMFVVPYSKERSLDQQAYFQNGSDILIPNWSDYGYSVEDVSAISNVQSSTHVRLFTIYSGVFERVRMLVINQSHFQSTIEQPQQRVTKLKWERLDDLTEDNVIVSQNVLRTHFKEIGDELRFSNRDLEVDYSVEIIDTFELFPVFFFEEDVANDERMIIISAECFEQINYIVTKRILTYDFLFVKVNSNTNVNSVKQSLFEMTQSAVLRSHEDVKDSLKTPLYNIFIIELILSMFVSLAVLVFSTITTAIKILEKRVIKHDIMKKVGIKVHTIINLSTIESFIAAIVPAMIIGSTVGFLVIPRTLSLLEYGITAYTQYIVYPWMLLIIAFLGIPVILYLNMRYILRREFEQYAPTQME